MKPRNFKLEFYQPTGQDCYRVVITDLDNNQKAAINSPPGDLEDKTERRIVLDYLFSSESFAYMLRQRIFPRDTLIYESRRTTTGVVTCNPRYPDGE